MAGADRLSRRRHRGSRRSITTLGAACVAGAISAMMPPAVQAAADPTITVPCSVPALISAFDTANSVPSTPVTIVLRPFCTYRLSDVDNTSPNGPNGLPVVVNRNLTVNGSGATISRRDPTRFRILEVGGDRTPGNLTLNDVTISNGDAGTSGLGGGILADAGGALAVNRSRITGNSAGVGSGIGNSGTATVTRSVISANTVSSSTTGALLGGGIFNGNEGATMVLADSRVMLNRITNNGRGSVCAALGCVASGAGIFNGGALTLTRTQVTGNTASAPRQGGVAMGAGIFTGGTLSVADGSAISRNTATSGTGSTGGGIWNEGTAGLSNSEVTDNVAFTTAGASLGGGIFNRNTTTNAVTLSNSRVVRNRPDQCFASGSTVVGC